MVARSLVVGAVLLMAGPTLGGSVTPAATRPMRFAACDARASGVAGHALTWHLAAPQAAALAQTAADTLQSGDAQEAQEQQNQWCRAVGPPVYMPAEATDVPALHDIAFLSWNAHLGAGRLLNLLRDLRAGTLTEGEPVRHFVLLLQEVSRHGDEVPPFDPAMRAAFEIAVAAPSAPEAWALGGTLPRAGAPLSVLYVPSMRNGAARREDRGSAIIASLPLRDLFAAELPLERQRRVAVGAAVTVRTTDKSEHLLHVLDAHLEPVSAPGAMWFFRNPRRRQVSFLLDVLQAPRFTQHTVGVVLGGDFNSVQGDADRQVIAALRAWARPFAAEDRRPTHALGRLDHIYARVPGYRLHTTRVDNRYGSDHHPILARFRSSEVP